MWYIMYRSSIVHQIYFDTECTFFVRRPITKDYESQQTVRAML